MTMPEPDLGDIGASGKLRVAINTGNRALVQVSGETFSGVSPALARRLCHELGLEMQPVVYEGAGKVFDDAGNDVWDLAFLAIDPIRAERVSFTRPYHVIEATYAVRAESGLTDVEEVDREDVTVLTSTGSAYDMYLRKNLNRARLEHSGTPTESFAEFREGRANAVAGVRASLQNFFGEDPAVLILNGTLTRVEQAMVLPGASNPLITALDQFVDKAIADGFVAAQLAG